VTDDECDNLRERAELDALAVLWFVRIVIGLALLGILGAFAAAYAMW
jgi:hypothetical protein